MGVYFLGCDSPSATRDMVAILTPEQVVTAVGALGFGGTIAIWLIKQKLQQLFRIVDRVPPKEWFVRIETKLDELHRGFDPERMRDHFAGQHAHANAIQRHEIKITSLEREVTDHEDRIRKIEAT